MQDANDPLNESFSTSSPNNTSPIDGANRLSAVRSIEEIVEQSRSRAVQFVLAISENTHVTLGKRIDELDNLRARIKKSENALQFYVGEFAKSNAEALILAEHMKKDIEEAAVPFSKDPPATITQELKEPT